MSIGARLSAGIGLDAALGEVTSRLDRLQSSLDDFGRVVGKLGDANPVHSPFPRRIVAERHAGQLAWSFIDCGGPSFGYLWSVRRLVLTGSDPSAALANVGACVFISSAAPPDSATLPGAIIDLVDHATYTLPHFYGPWDAQVVSLNPGERLVVGISGVVSGTQVLAYGQAVQTLETDREGRLA